SYNSPTTSYTLLRCFFFFNDTATTEIYTLSLHDALPICQHRAGSVGAAVGRDLRRLEPVAVGVAEEVFPGRRRAIDAGEVEASIDRKSTRLNSSHVAISYAVFCLKKKKDTRNNSI